MPPRSWSDRQAVGSVPPRWSCRGRSLQLTPASVRWSRRHHLVYGGRGCAGGRRFGQGQRRNPNRMILGPVARLASRWLARPWVRQPLPQTRPLAQAWQRRPGLSDCWSQRTGDGIEPLCLGNNQPFPWFQPAGVPNLPSAMAQPYHGLVWRASPWVKLSLYN